MTPIKFKEANVTYAENQPEYLPLPAYRDDTDPNGTVISCWKLTFKERLQLLLTGKLWVSLMTFKHPLQPSFFTANKWDLFNKPAK